MFHLSRRRFITLIVIPAAVFLAAYVVTVIPYLKFTRGIYAYLLFILIADLAAIVGGGWRDGLTVVATIVFGLATGEVVCASLGHGISTESRGFSAARSVIGWGPAAPGVYHGSRRTEGGGMIYSADYTIDRNLLRRTVSGDAGPSVAFFGDSMTFGQGLNDADTMPQAYADLTGRKFRVYNFGFPGYGPQQFLHVLDTGIFDWLLKDTKLFVYETAAWHAERASCLASFMARAPRYDIVNGKLVMRGACSAGTHRAVEDIFLSSALYQTLVAPATKRVGAGDIEIYLAEIERCARWVKEKYGARLVILYLADNDAYLAHTGFTDATIEASLRHDGIEVIDATLSPKDFPPGTLLTIPGDGHPSAIANRARAALLRNYLDSHAATAVHTSAK